MRDRFEKRSSVLALSLFVLRDGKICHFLNAKRPVKKRERKRRGREETKEITRFDRRSEEDEIEVESFHR